MRTCRHQDQNIQASKPRAGRINVIAVGFPVLYNIPTLILQRGGLRVLHSTVVSLQPLFICLCYRMCSTTVFDDDSFLVFFVIVCSNAFILLSYWKLRGDS